MSAYLCSDSTIAMLAAYAASHDAVIYDWQTNDWLSTARNAAAHMAQANLDSLAARYGDSTDNPEFVAACADRAEHYYFNPPRLTMVEIYKSARCFAYQSCEVDDWENSLAARQVRWITEALMRELPGYEAAPWGWEDSRDVPPKAERPIMLSSLFSKPGEPA